MTAKTTDTTPPIDPRALLAESERLPRAGRRRRSVETFVSFTRGAFALFLSTALLLGGTVALLVQIAVQIRTTR